MRAAFHFAGPAVVSALLAWLMLGSVAWAGGPKPAPPVFVSVNYALTFRSPPNAMICPLAPDWVGTDHGTTIFLAPPGDCGGAGFASSNRGFSNTPPRIEVYYQYWLHDPNTPPPRCRRTVGSIKLIGKARPLCRAKDNGTLELSASAAYSADARAWVLVSLVTTPDRLKADTAALRNLAASVKPCRQTWSTTDGRSGVFGTGAACPADGVFF